jgi:hypothetical protein
MGLFLLQDVCPDLAEELHLAFCKEGRPDLADQVWELEIVEQCPCEDPACATFYTRPNEVWHGRIERFFLDVPGLICVHTVNSRIARVELLDRLEVRQTLLQLSDVKPERDVH